MHPEEEKTHPDDSEEGPEEGEILSDNILEDISDESIIFTPNGKSIHNNQHLHALSLSSVSDTTTQLEEIVPKYRRKRRKSYGQRGGHCSKRKRPDHKRRDSSTSSSDHENTTLDKRLKMQLKAAVRLDLMENAHKNSLRTRLNAMVNGCTNELKSDTDTIEIVASGSESTNEVPKREDLDNELIQLRLEALKTAISNKYAKRKRRKSEMNKENNKLEQALQTETNSDNKNSENTNSLTLPSPPPVEEDEDVLRAILLASISKKITSNQPEPTTNNKNLKINQYSSVKMVLNNMKKIIKVPQVKPLIINLNSESDDSDWDLSSSQEKSPKKSQKMPKNNQTILEEKSTEKLPQNWENTPKQIENKIENKMLEENLDKNCQGKVSHKISLAKTEQVENTQKPQEINIENNKIKSKGNATNMAKNSKFKEIKTISIIENSVEKFLKEQRAKVESMTWSLAKSQPKKMSLNKTQLEPKSPDLEKSALKFLPANKMEEYKKLQNLIKQKKAQQLLTKNKSNKSTQTVKEVQLPDKLKTQIDKHKKFELNLLKIDQEKRSCASVLRTILKQLEMKNHCGRFQIQEKYKILRPMIKKINETNKEQKQCDQDIDRLMQQLTEARQRQEELHRKMLTSVTTLADEKKKIDLSFSKEPIKALITSTPIKPLLATFTVSSPMASAIAFDQSEVNALEQSTICNNQPPKDGAATEVIDPNGIDKIIKNTEKNVAVLEQAERCDDGGKKVERIKYVSPLDGCQRKAGGGILDPFVIMCPFEVNGTCKDPECVYNHLSK